MSGGWSRSVATSSASGGDHYLSAFHNREQAFEIQYSIDENLKFRVNCRRNKLIGLWGAEMMGLSGDAAQEYAHGLVVANLRKTGDDVLVRRIVDDLAQHGVSVSESEVVSHLGQAMVTASAQVREEKQGASGA